MSDPRVNFFKTGKGAKLLRQLKKDRKDGEAGVYDVRGQTVFEESLERRLTHAKYREGLVKELREAGFKEDFDATSEKKLANFVGSWGFAQICAENEEQGEAILSESE